MTSGDNLLKNRSRASTSEYKQLPINCPLFQNTVKLTDKFLQESRNLKLENRYSILSQTKQSCFGTGNLEKVKVCGFKYIQVHSKQGNFWKKETITLYLNVSLNTILSTDIYVDLEQEVCVPSRSEYIRLLAIILDLPSEYDK